MKIYYLGHSCFHIQTDSKINIITDPYQTGAYSGTLRYSAIDIQPDIVTVSHSHPDHNYVKEFTKAKVIDQVGKANISGVEVEGVLSYHDKSQGLFKGKNIIFVITADNLRIAHFGDLGTTNLDYNKLQNIDIAMIPTGGNFTIDAKEAEAVCEKLNPRIIIPMHFKTHKLDAAFGIPLTEEDFIRGKKGAERMECIILRPGDISSYSKKIIVLNFQR